MNYMKETLFRLILLADNRPTISDKIAYFFQVIGTFIPLAYLMDGLNLWFKNNQQFSSFILICLIVNMIVGIAYHLKMMTFNFVEMFKKNVLMWFVLIIVYMMLEMLRLTAGNNFVGEGFKIIIQVTTLLYPISKVLKNVYVLSNKQFPPAFIMDRVYNFEKNGDLGDLFDNEKD